MPNPIWSPSPQRAAASQMARFLAEMQAAVPAVEDYRSLYRWSIDDPAAFWAEVWRFCDVVASRRGEETVRRLEAMPGACWFPGARLSFAENLLRFRDERQALVSWNEAGRRRVLTYGELYSEVARVRRALERMGVGAGDRVAGFMPNLSETVVAMLGATSLGALWTSCSPDFGVKGVLDRFGQIAPRVLFAADGYVYGGKRFDLLERVRRIAEAIGSIERVVVVPYSDHKPDLGSGDRAVAWPDFLGGDAGGEVEFVQLPFDHPLYVMYSSGTTGLPKCMVHGAGGTLLQHLKELRLHTDLERRDRIFYYTTCGWMMWNWVVSSLAVGATVVLYDGHPFKPSPAQLFDLAAAERLSVFGTSAKYLALAEKEGLRPRGTHELGDLRAILSTGSPLAPRSFDYVYRDVNEDLQLASISGGTDLISCFALGNPLLPVYRGELQGRGLGMAVEVWNDAGEPVVGEAGELVCRRPFPSMPVGFWDDPQGAKYRAAYFEHFPGVWHHGDWAALTERDTMVIYGRSDATLNPGGIRIGTAEIYRQVEALEEVIDSVAIDQEWNGDSRVVLFVQLRDDLVLDEPLRDRIRRRIRENTSPHHVPKKILQVPDVPRTLSNKVSEIAVRKAVAGEVIQNREALANPEALEHFRDREELAG